MPFPKASWWAKVPCARLLFCVIAGIRAQWCLQVEIEYLWCTFLIALFFVGFYSLLPVATRYRVTHLSGYFLFVVIAVTGALLVWCSDIRHDRLWVGRQDLAGACVIATIEEPLVEKANSWKAVASVHFIVKKDVIYSAKGKLLFYFKKDTALPRLGYGSRIVFNKELQVIRNSNNPGSFNFQQYYFFQGITHQVYFAENDFVLLPGENRHWFSALIFNCIDWVVHTLKKFVPAGKEQGMAEALLIGYKEDLDKGLVQAYSNTGVVHIIAISGLHLGLIYGLLLLLTKPLRKRQLIVMRLALILAGLWMFSIMAGAQPSVLRSAVMFSFIALGEVLGRKGSVFNTLALSAFVLLIYNPFWLWDVGFQLSYAAVLSILLFFRPVYNWFYFTNKLLDYVWKLNAVTIAAQLLTLPVTVFYFHQVPVLFLFTNLVAVPLSGVILVTEILVCIVAFAAPVAHLSGVATKWMIWCMNSYIERWENVAFSTWTDLSVSGIQALLLAGVLMGFCFWIMEKSKLLLRLSLCLLLCFTTLRSISFFKAAHQKKLVVYNVPGHRAIDIIDGRNCHFICDPELLNNDNLINFHLRPSRVAGRIKTISCLATKSFDFYDRQVIIIDSSLKFQKTDSKITVDLLILSGNPKFYIGNFLTSFSVKQIVIDGSVPAWKSGLWKRDCDSLHIPCHNVSQQGAFVLNL